MKDDECTGIATIGYGPTADVVPTQVIRGVDPSRVIVVTSESHVVVDARCGRVASWATRGVLRLVDKIEKINASLSKDSEFCGLELRHVFIDIYGTANATLEFLHDVKTVTDKIFGHGDVAVIHPIVDRLRGQDQEFSDGILLSLTVKVTKCSPGSDHFDPLHVDYYREWLPRSHPSNATR